MEKGIRKAALIASLMLAMVLSSCGEDSSGSSQFSSHQNSEASYSSYENSEASHSSYESEAPSEYKITWQNYDGEVLDVNYVEQGEYPRYQGDEPTRPEDEQYSYVFSGWTPKVRSAYSDATYKATYDGKVREYTITWEDYDGTVLKEDVLAYGETPSYGQDPERAGDARYSYVFTGWVPEVAIAKGNQIYKASYESEINKYKVTWEDYDGTPILEEEWEYGSTPVYEGEKPKREGDAQYSYTFTGWESIDEGPLKKDRVYVAEYNNAVNEYQITWEDYDGDVLRVDSVAYGNTPSYGKNPAREGDAQYTYTFSNWEPSVEKVTGDATYKAVYANTTNRYAVTWKDYDGTTLKVQSYDYGDVPSYGETPSRDPEPYESYVFEGWEPEVGEVTRDVVYTAKYSKQMSTSFVISYDANGGSGAPESQTKLKGGSLTLRAKKPSRSGYVFLGWNNVYQSKIYQPGDSFEADINLTMVAMWATECEECHGNGHYCISGDYVDCPTCKKVGWVCSECGRTVDSTYYAACPFCGSAITKCKTCGGYGRYYPPHSCYSCDERGYYLEDGPRIVSIGEKEITLERTNGYEYSRDGVNFQYSSTFSGLTPGFDYYFYQRRATKGSVPFGCTSVARSAKTKDPTEGSTVFYIRYKLDGGTLPANAPTSFVYKSYVGVLYEPTKEHYTFSGWDCNWPDQCRYSYDYSRWILDADTPSDVTLTAKWVQTGYSINYDLQGGTNNEENPKTHGIEDAEITLKDPTRTGAVFTGWTGSNGDVPEKNVKIPANSTGELSYTANWELIEYSITYDLGGGTLSSPNPSSYNVESSFDLITPTREGYTLEGWHIPYQGTISSISEGTTGDLYIFAVWNTISYSITYSLDGGDNSSSNPSSYYVGSDDIELQDPAKDGYTFEGWYSDSSYSNKVESIPSGSTGNRSYYAKWRANKNSLSVASGDESKGSVSVSGEGYTDEEITVSASPREHYQFSGWYSGDTLVSSSASYTFSMPSSNYSLVGKFEAVEYSITYNLSGGKNASSNPDKYTVESPNIVLSDPTRDGYAFEGWYSDSSYSDKVESIPSGSSGDLALWAKWKANKYSLSVASSDQSKGSVSFSASGECCTGEEITVMATPIGDYAFAGWYCNGKRVSDDEQFTFAMPAYDCSLTALFWTNDDARQPGVAPTVDEESGTVTYGLYPQTHVSDEETIASLNALAAPQANGWYYLDGEWYAKKEADPFYSDYAFDDGTTIAEETTYWFKCEPITWKILSSSNGKYSLVSTVLLDAHRFNKSWSGTDSDGYYANNYARSEIRAWLNDDFYNSAFSLGNSCVQTTNVSNSASTTESSTNIYACPTTKDKVYLLSYQDYKNTSYFADDDGDELCCKTTDWARASGATYESDSESYLYNGWYWTRSPSASDYYGVSSISNRGNFLLFGGSVYSSWYCVRPAITIKIS